MIEAVDENPRTSLIFKQVEARSQRERDKVNGFLIVYLKSLLIFYFHK